MISLIILAVQPRAYLATYTTPLSAQYAVHAHIHSSASARTYWAL